MSLVIPLHDSVKLYTLEIAAFVVYVSWSTFFSFRCRDIAFHPAIQQQHMHIPDSFSFFLFRGRLLLTSSSSSFLSSLYHLLGLILLFLFVCSTSALPTSLCLPFFAPLCAIWWPRCCLYRLTFQSTSPYLNVIFNYSHEWNQCNKYYWWLWNWLLVGFSCLASSQTTIFVSRFSTLLRSRFPLN